MSIWIAYCNRSFFIENDLDIRNLEHTFPLEGPLRNVFMAKGTVLYRHIDSVISNSTGRLIELKKAEGDSVFQGQELARVVDPQIKFEKATVLLEIEGVERSVIALNREVFIIDQLIKVGGAAQSQYDDKFQERAMKNQLKNKLELKIKQLDQKIHSTAQLSSLTGIVISVPVKTNQWVSGGQELMTIAGGGSHIVTHIDVLDLGKIYVGQEVLYSEHENSANKFRGVVQSIATTTSIEYRRNSVQIEILPTNMPTIFRLNQDIYVEFIIFDKHSVIYVIRTHFLRHPLGSESSSFQTPWVTSHRYFHGAVLDCKTAQYN